MPIARSPLRATDFLRQRWPKLSAAPPRWRTNIASVAVVTLLALAAAVLAPDGTTFAFEVTLAVVFLAWLGLRLAGAFVKGLICDSIVRSARRRAAGLYRDRRALPRSGVGRRLARSSGWIIRRLTCQAVIVKRAPPSLPAATAYRLW